MDSDEDIYFPGLCPPEGGRVGLDAEGDEGTRLFVEREVMGQDVNLEVFVSPGSIDFLDDVRD